MSLPASVGQKVRAKASSIRTRYSGRKASMVAFVVIGLALFSSIGAVLNVFWADSGTFEKQQGRQSLMSQRTEERADALEQQVLAQQQLIDALSTSKGVPADAGVAALRREVAAQGRKLEALGSAVSGDPAKAVELPLLQRDVDALNQRVKDADASLTRDIDRQYDLMKWILGTLALGLIGFLVPLYQSAFRKPKADAVGVTASGRSDDPVVPVKQKTKAQKKRA